MVDAVPALCPAVALVSAQKAGAEPWCGPAPGLAGPGADLYQVRADPLDPPRPAARRHRRRTDAAARPRAAVRLPAVDEADRRTAGPEDQRRVQSFRRRAAGLGLGGASARRAAQERRRSGGESHSPGPQADHRPGPGVAVHPCPAAEGCSTRCQACSSGCTKRVWPTTPHSAPKLAAIKLP